MASLPSRPVTSSTLFYTGSTTKAFTSAAWAQIIHSEENEKKSKKITFATPLSEIIRDDFVLSDEYATTHLTIEDALSHRTGMSRHDLTYGGPIDTPQKVVRSMRYLPLTSEPRTKHEYCNMMYIAASHALETITGKWLGTTLKEQIWEPLDMKNTFFDLKDAQECKGVELARGYRWIAATDDGKDSRYIEEAFTVFPEVSGAGCIISNVLDYAKWMQMLFNRGLPLVEIMHKDILNPRSIDVDYREPYDGVLAYALGWEIFSYKGERMVWHNGGLTGYGTNLLYLPDRKWGCVIMANTSLTSNYLSHSLTMHLIDDYLDVPAEQRFDHEESYRKLMKDEEAKVKNARKELYPSIPEKPLPMTLPIQSYAGTYTHPAYRSLSFKVAEHTDNETGKTIQVLSANAQDRAWPFVMRMGHINAEYWIAYKIRGNGEKDRAVQGAVKAEFKVGENGEVSKVGIAMEEGLGNYKFWFEKISA